MIPTTIPYGVPYRMGQVGSAGDLADIKFRATVIPFVAVLTGVFVGYLLVKPTMDDVRWALGILQKAFPLLGGRA